MIFVTVGTHEQPFNRLLEMVDALKLGTEIVVQYGFSTYPLKHCTPKRFVEFHEMRRLMSAAEAVVSHGGVGSIMLALSSGKCPLVVPRLHRFGEHVDDHQIEVADAFARFGKVTLLKPGEGLVERLEEARRQSGSHAIRPSSTLVEFLNNAIRASARS